MELKSKSQAKREMLALQGLGERLVELTVAQIEKVEMPRDLRDAVLFAKTLKRNEARRRQFQYIGVLMRQVDTEPILKALEAISRGHGLEKNLFRKLEKWRDGLIDGDEEIWIKIVDTYPDLDRQRLRQMVLNARKEKEGNRPPKYSRALFRYLKEMASN